MASAKPKGRTTKTKKPSTGKVHRFQKGNVHAKKGGRRPGQKNKFTRELKEVIIQAAAEIGEDGKGRDDLLGYLRMCARKHTKQYIGLLARVMPLQITGDVGGLIGQVNIVSVPMDRYLAPDEAKRLTAPQGDIVDAEFVETSSEEDAA